MQIQANKRGKIMDKQYTRDFTVYFRPIMEEELEKYKDDVTDILERLEANARLLISLKPDGNFTHHFIDLDDFFTFLDEKEPAYTLYEDYDERDNKSYSYKVYDNEEAGDEWRDNRYGQNFKITIVTGYVDPAIIDTNEKIIKIGDEPFKILDKETGLVALAYPVRYYDDDYYYEGIEALYLDSLTESIIKDIEKDIDTSVFKKQELKISESIKKEYELTELDFNQGNAINQIITGETGCGKTYQAVNDEEASGRKFAYIAPCRQLAYETYRYYADPFKNKDKLSTGEVKINSDSDGNFYGVFESLTPEMIKEGQFDTLIIDEGHFVKDSERGGHLLSLIAACRESNINIKILTATQNFTLNDFEEIRLKSRFKVPEKVEISYDEAIANVSKRMQTLWFCGSIEDTENLAEILRSHGVKAVAMNSNMTPSERLEVQIAFEEGKIQVVCATNVLAQGVNFACENMVIEYDPFETPEQQQQKIGRLGRPGTLQDKNEVYYCVCNKMRDVEKDNNKTKIEKYCDNKEHIEDQLDLAIYRIKQNDKDTLYYNDIKYCIPEFQSWAQEFLADPRKIIKDLKIKDTDGYDEKEHINNMTYKVQDLLHTIQLEQSRLTKIILENSRPVLNMEKDKEAKTPNKKESEKDKMLRSFEQDLRKIVKQDQKSPNFSQYVKKDKNNEIGK